AEARDQAAARPEVAARLWLVALRSLRKALIHPVPLPIIAGLLFAQTGLVMPAWLDTPMSWLGKAFGPLALMLVGVSLASSYVGRHLRGALSISLLKNLLVPTLAGVLGWLFGMSGQPLAVMIVMAALPVGANAFLFSQRYGVAQETITASIAVSTALSAVTVSLAVVLLGG
ncbi:MAG: AEC family transporter, partial [Rhodoferax sp.]|nr:AEC family transporter [Rhodoferax sp.]